MKRIAVLFLLFPMFLFGQQKTLEGHILNKTDVEGVHILNTTSRINAVTNQDGVFSIKAQVQDSLFISSVKYQPKKILITSEMYLTGKLSFVLDELVNELDEVFLGPNLSGNLERDLKSIKTEEKFNFDDVGIPGFKGKPEEKIVPIVPGIGLVTAVDIEAMYKHITGYYKKLKKQRKWDGQNAMVSIIINFYTSAFFVEAYQIPQERQYDFMLFCIETSSLQDDFKNENYAGVLQIFSEKSKEYVSRLSETPSEKEAPKN